MALLSSAKRFLAMFSAAAISAVGLVAISSTGASAAVTPSVSYEATREINGGVLNLRAGESANFAVQMYSNQFAESSLLAGDTLTLNLGEQAGADVTATISYGWSIGGGQLNSTYYSESRYGYSTPAATNTMTISSDIVTSVPTWFNMTASINVTNNSSTTASTYTVNPSVTAVLGGVSSTLTTTLRPATLC